MKKYNPKDKFKGELRVRSKTWEGIDPNSTIEHILDIPISAIYEIGSQNMVNSGRGAILIAYETSNPSPYFVQWIKFKVKQIEEIPLNNSDKLSVYGITEIIKKGIKREIKDRDSLNLAINKIKTNLNQFLTSNQPTK